MSALLPEPERWSERPRGGATAEDAVGLSLRDARDLAAPSDARLARVGERLMTEREPRSARTAWAFAAVLVALLVVGGTVGAARGSLRRWAERRWVSVSRGEASAPPPRRGHAVRAALASPASVVEPAAAVQPASEPLASPPTSIAAAPSSLAEVTRTDRGRRAHAAERAHEEASFVEARILARAFHALRTEHDAAAALRDLDEHARRFPGGALDTEARLARVEALIALGRSSEALALLERWPGNGAAPTRAVRLARGELLADDGRCLEAARDFDAVVVRSDADAVGERALYRRAACDLRARDTRRTLAPISSATCAFTRTDRSRVRRVSRSTGCAPWTRRRRNVPRTADMRGRGDVMKTFALVACTFTIALASACGTNTPVGVVSPGQGGGTGGTSLATDAGGSPGAAGSAGQRGPYVPSGPTITAGDQPFTSPAGTGEVWTGYFESFQLPSGSDGLRLSFARDASGAETLTVVVGANVAPAAPQDPTQAWPDPNEAPVTFKGQAVVAEGFSYPAHEVRWQGSRLTFKLDSAEAWGAWCGIQASFPVDAPPGGYNCVPGPGGGLSTDAQGNCVADDTMPGRGPYGPHVVTIVSCAQLVLCSPLYCACNATGCGPTPTHNLAFDITFADGLASGSGQVNGALHTLHLTPAAN